MSFVAMKIEGDKSTFYKELNTQLDHLLAGESDYIANLANAASLLDVHLDTINWAGFYLWREEQLILGPFMGKPACVRIPLGRGVCGTAAETRVTQVVPDVHAFPGHIACDAASRSEIVVPILVGDRLIGVLDIDSPVPERFDDADREGLEAFVEVLNKHIDWSRMA
ncbi:GAF domain-containing protein [Tumebacillus sp. DT12]|uniref:GAF domain-containing protein n=1 Tax=Tumebacillus lacus TaxID=2995335 RepID=A0ABT3X562_9BACL|nr:GAF domain-containing protein [Tumebacillus lacus]MCX7569869.1 GAF domain-containing protein [Tumebacillus lacus]